MSGALDKFAKSLMQDLGQDKSFTSGFNKVRIAYPAIVVSNEDPFEQGRIVARMISLDREENIVGGKDKDTPDDKLPFALPLRNSFLEATPLIGEMVIILMENPNDQTSVRYWIGPFISSKLKLAYQSFKEAIKAFDYTNFNVNQRINSRPSDSRNWPNKSDVALLGRDDAQIILKPRELNLSAGILKRGTFESNEHPATISMKQHDVDPSQESELISHSRIEVNASNINIFSERGKFRKKDLSKFEANEDLKSFGDLANTLHPSVFGDELVKLLDIMIKLALTHVHTPQDVTAEDQYTKLLEEYSIEGKLQNLLSKHVRIN